MKRLLIALAVITSTAHAECYMRSAAIKQMPVAIQRITDMQRSVVPLPNKQFRCVVTFRAQINNQWYTGEGVNTGTSADSLDQICAGAMDSGKSHILEDIGGSKITVDQDMVCTDQPIPKVHAVRVGDVIKESEVSPHPAHPQLFNYSNTQCRWFIETDTVGNNLVQYQGIACRVRKGEWQVVDKF